MNDRLKVLERIAGLVLQARRAQADAAEGFARKPGALFTSRLKAAPWWDEVMRASGRVGTRLLKV